MRRAPAPIGAHGFWKRGGSLLGTFALLIFSTTTVIATALTLSAAPAGATGPYVTTIAGTGTSGETGDGGPALSANLNWAGQLVVDSSGNTFFIDNAGGSHNGRIREISASTGNITTVPGLSTLQFVNGLVIDSSGNLYLATGSSGGSNYVMKWTASTGVLSTVAGSGTGGYSGDGGPATSAKLYLPQGLALDSSGNLYIADLWNHVVRKVTASTGDISTVAGNGTNGNSGIPGPATSAELEAPTGVTVDSSGNLYISDQNTGLVTEVTASTGNISKLATLGLYYLAELAIDSSGNLYLADGSAVDEIVPSTLSVTALAAPSGGYSGAQGVAVDSSGNVYVGDSSHNKVDEISSSPLPINFSPATLNFASKNILTTSSTQTVTVKNTSLSSLTISSDSIADGTYADFVKSSDSCNGTSLASGSTCSIAVTFTPSAGGTRWADLTFSDGISSGLNHVFLVGVGVGYVTTIAGTGTMGETGDGGPALSAKLYGALQLEAQRIGDRSGIQRFLQSTSFAVNKNATARAS